MIKYVCTMVKQAENFRLKVTPRFSSVQSINLEKIPLVPFAATTMRISDYKKIARRIDL